MASEASVPDTVVALIKRVDKIEKELQFLQRHNHEQAETALVKYRATNYTGPPSGRRT